MIRGGDFSVDKTDALVFALALLGIALVAWVRSQRPSDEDDDAEKR